MKRSRRRRVRAVVDVLAVGTIMGGGIYVLRVASTWIEPLSVLLLLLALGLVLGLLQQFLRVRR